jgi:hypothetical protein
LGIVHEEGTDNNLDQCFSTGVPRNPRVPQGSLGICVILTLQLPSL